MTPHQGIVDNHSKLVGPGAIGTPEHEVAAVAGEIGFLRAENTVGELYLGIGHGDTHGMCSLRSRRKRRQPTRSAGAGIYNETVGGMRRLCGHDIGARAEAGVGQPGAAQCVEGAFVELMAPALHIWPVRATPIGAAFVPVKAEPCEVVFDEAGIFRP